MNKEPSPKNALREWLAESFRLTLFPGTDKIETATSLWPQELAEIEEQVSRGRSKETEIIGAFDSGKLVLRTNPERIDCLFLTDINKEYTEFPFPTLGILPDKLEVFQSVTSHILKSHTAANRIAFGTITNLPVSDRVKGYETISTYLPFDVDGNSAEDFSYSINRPRQHPVDSRIIKINRLTKWSVALLQFVQVKVADATLHTPTALGKWSACRMEFDINTDPDNQEPLVISALLPILMNQAIEIVEKGDIR